MDEVYCPLAADWGNVADWVTILLAGMALAITFAGLIISAIGAIAVAYLGIKANTVAKQSHEVNARLVEHEIRLAGESKAVSDAERRLILSELYGAAIVARSGFQMCKVFLKANAGEKLRTPDGLENLTGLLRGSEIRISDAIHARLHMVGEPLAPQIVRVHAAPASMLAYLSIALKMSPENDPQLVEHLSSGCDNALEDLMALLREANAAMLQAGVPRAAQLKL